MRCDRKHVGSIPWGGAPLEPTLGCGLQPMVVFPLDFLCFAPSLHTFLYLAKCWRWVEHVRTSLMREDMLGPNFGVSHLMMVFPWFLLAWMLLEVWWEAMGEPPSNHVGVDLMGCLGIVEVTSDFGLFLFIPSWIWLIIKGEMCWEAFRGAPPWGESCWGRP